MSPHAWNGSPFCTPLARVYYYPPFSFLAAAISGVHEHPGASIWITENLPSNIAVVITFHLHWVTLLDSECSQVTQVDYGFGILFGERPLKSKLLYCNKTSHKKLLCSIVWDNLDITWRTRHTWYAVVVFVGLSVLGLRQRTFIYNCSVLWDDKQVYSVRNLTFASSCLFSSLLTRIGPLE